MKSHKIILVLFLFLSGIEANAQEQDTSTSRKKWEGSADMNFYFFKDDFIILPVLRVDINKLHLEARYNYESEKTVSVWTGYNLSGGKNFEYLFTPMLGLVIGETSGFAPGLEMTLGFHSFELYSESEYFVDPGTAENDFFYMWTDLTWSPTDWIWVGLSGQRTRLYESDVDIQHGFLLGGGFKNWEFSGYLYNPGNEDLFFLASLSFGF